MTEREITNQQRDFKGMWIPAKFWLDPNLTIMEMCLIAEIDSLDINEKGCFKSNDSFSKFLGVSASRVSQIINGLKKKGFISIKYIYDVDHPKQITKRIMHVVNNLNRGSKKTKGGYLENCEDSNTVSSLVVKGNPDEQKNEEPKQNSKTKIIDESLTDHPLAYYQQAFGMPARGTLTMVIDGYARAHSFPWVNSAMRIAAVKGKTWDYALAIIQKWEANGWNTPDEVEAGNQRYLEQKRQQHHAHDAPEKTAFDVPEVTVTDVIRDALDENGMDVGKTVAYLNDADIHVTEEEVRAVANG